MINVQQVVSNISPQQTDIIPYQDNTQSVSTQQFLDMVSILPTMMVMFFMMMMMSMMRDVMQPGGAKKVISTGAKVAAPALAFIPYAGPAISEGATALSKSLEEK